MSGVSYQALSWVVAQIGDGVAIEAAHSLHGGESPWWIDLRTAEGSPLAVIFRSPSCRIDPDMIATNAAALAVAAQHGLPAPRLLGVDLDGLDVGTPMSVEWSFRARALGPSIVCRTFCGRREPRLLESTRSSSNHGQLFRPRPRPIAVDDFARERRLGRMPTTNLLRRADERVLEVSVPAGPTVFVHGDVWPGNIMVADGRGLAFIDWKTRWRRPSWGGSGELRKQVAIAYGAEAPEFVLEGWERATGSRAQDVPFWDATAASNTPTGSTGPAGAARRDDFLSTALAQL